jgi:hypothetical protein
MLSFVYNKLPDKFKSIIDSWKDKEAGLYFLLIERNLYFNWVSAVSDIIARTQDPMPAIDFMIQFGPTVTEESLIKFIQTFDPSRLTPSS